MWVEKNTQTLSRIWSNFLCFLSDGTTVHFCLFIRLICFPSRMLFVLSGEQTGVRGTLQDCARWELRAGVAGRHEVLHPDTIVTTAAHEWNILPALHSSKNSWFDVDTNPVCVCSTNGTVINMSKLVKKQTYMLQSGDVIYFVYRKSEPEQSTLSFFFQAFPKSPKGPVSTCSLVPSSG